MIVLEYIFIVVTFGYVLTLTIFLVGLFFPNTRQQTNQYMVSVIVPARNEAKNIVNILSDLTLQTYAVEKFEVIIVDDHSTDETYEIVKQIANQHQNIKLIRATEDKSGRLKAKKNAISQGIDHSQGEIILATDADCRVPTTWIETMVSYFTEEVGMVVGFSQMGQKGEKRTILEQLQAIDFLALLSSAQGSLNLSFPLAATGQNLAYRKQAFKEVGGYLEVGHRISGDDVLLLQLINQRTNWEIRFAPDSASFSYTYPEKTLRGLLRQRNRWASNGSYQFKLNKIFFLIVVDTFLMDLLTLFSVPLVLIFPVTFFQIMCCISLKFLLELLIIVKGSLVYNRTDLLKYFPIWVVVQIPYVVIVGIWGNFKKFVWKGRKI